MKFFLDRFEGDRAVVECEDDDGAVSFLTVSRSSVSSNSREGDALILNGSLYETDAELTASRRAEILRKLEKLSGSDAKEKK